VGVTIPIQTQYPARYIAPSDARRSTAWAANAAVREIIAKTASAGGTMCNRFRGFMGGRLKHQTLDNGIRGARVHNCTAARGRQPPRVRWRYTLEAGYELRRADN
jgi:hypothetical protein